MHREPDARILGVWLYVRGPDARVLGVWMYVRGPNARVLGVWQSTDTRNRVKQGSQTPGSLASGPGADNTCFFTCSFVFSLVVSNNIHR